MPRIGIRGKEFGLSTMQRVLRNSGGERVADDAAEELSKTLEDLGYRISKMAIGFAPHAGRDTIRAEDIKLAIKYVIDSK